MFYHQFIIEQNMFDSCHMQHVKSSAWIFMFSLCSTPEGHNLTRCLPVHMIIVKCISWQTPTLWVRAALWAVWVWRTTRTETLWRIPSTRFAAVCLMVWMLLSSVMCWCCHLTCRLKSVWPLTFQRSLTLMYGLCSLPRRNTSWTLDSASLPVSCPASKTGSGQFTHNPQGLSAGRSQDWWLYLTAFSSLGCCHGDNSLYLLCFRAWPSQGPPPISIPSRISESSDTSVHKHTWNTL